MLKTFFNFLSKLVGNSAARVMTGAGVGLVSYAVLMPLAVAALNAASAGIGGIPGNLAAMFNLLGLGIVLSNIGTAMLVRVAIDSAGVGIAKTGGLT